LIKYAGNENLVKENKNRVKKLSDPWNCTAKVLVRSNRVWQNYRCSLTEVLTFISLGFINFWKQPFSCI